MCLRSCFKEPFVAEKDIIVWKAIQQRIDRDGNRKLCTPYMNVEVKLGEELEPDSQKGLISKISAPIYMKYIYECGWIHSWICPQPYFVHDYGEKFIKCIIPKGACFMVGINCNEICSEKLIIGKKVISYYDVVNSMNEKTHILDCLEYVFNLIDKTTVSEGWFYIENGSLMHPSEYFKNRNKNKIIGIVIQTRDNKAFVECIHQFNFFNFDEDYNEVLKKYIENDDRIGFSKKIVHHIKCKSIVKVPQTIFDGWLVPTYDELELLRNFKLRPYLYHGIYKMISVHEYLYVPNTNTVSFSNEFKINVLDSKYYNGIYKVFLVKEVNL